MTQEQLDGIANVSYGTIEKITWETATDWDNAVSETGVVHADIGDYVGASGVQLGYSATDPDLFHMAVFDESSGPIQDYSGNSISGTLNGGTLGVTGLHNTTALGLDGADDYVDYGSPTPYDASNLGSSFSIAIVVKPESGAFDGARHDLFGRTSGSYDDNFVIGADSGAWNIYADDGSNNNSKTGGSPTAGNRYLLIFTYDGTNATLYENGDNQVIQLSIFSGGIQSTGAPLRVSNGTTSYSDYFPGDIDMIQSFYRVLSSSERQALYDLWTGGTLTTATKSFGTAQTPDLQNLSYTLNGQSITLDVIGSPGTASEEVVSQTLDGATSYTLSWSNSHTDFRLRPDFSTTDPTASPTFEGGELSA